MSETTHIKLTKKKRSTETVKVYSKLSQIKAELFYQILMSPKLDLTQLIKKNGQSESLEVLEQTWNNLINEYESILQETPITGNLEDNSEIDDRKLRVLKLYYCDQLLKTGDMDAVKLLNEEGVNVTGINSSSFELMRSTLSIERTNLEIRQLQDQEINAGDKPFSFLDTLLTLGTLHKMTFPRDIDAESFAHLLMRSKPKKND